MCAHTNTYAYIHTHTHVNGCIGILHYINAACKFRHKTNTFIDEIVCARGSHCGVHTYPHPLIPTPIPSCLRPSPHAYPHPLMPTPTPSLLLQFAQLRLVRGDHLLHGHRVVVLQLQEHLHRGRVHQGEIHVREGVLFSILLGPAREEEGEGSDLSCFLLE